MSPVKLAQMHKKNLVVSNKLLKGKGDWLAPGNIINSNSSRSSSRTNLSLVCVRLHCSLIVANVAKNVAVPLLTPPLAPWLCPH